MEFQDFAKQRRRMCEYYSMGGCYHDKKSDICPICAVQDSTCGVFCLRHPKEAEEIVSKWAAEHPVMTNRQKFKEVFGVDADGGPFTCFWDQEYKEPTNED